MSNLSDKRSVTDWLPTTRKETELRGWDELDVVLFSGDAYIDHPSFGSAVIGRLLEHLGLSVAIVPQPNWRDDLRDFKKFGTPRLFFAVTAGCMDSMVNHYTAAKRLRSDDAYTPDGMAGFRPDYASVVYCNILKNLFPETPIVLGGIEASLRRVVHYDYWSDLLKPSILIDSKADLLIYGMGEKPLTELVKLLKKGVPFEKITDLPQSAINRIAIPKSKPNAWIDFELKSYKQCLENKRDYAENFKQIEIESNRESDVRFIQKHDNTLIIINPPYPTATTQEADFIYALPFTRQPHPKYKGKKIAAYEMIRHSINIHRGCFGGCSFCTISAHQGKFIVSRSEKSILAEVEQVVKMDDFKGYLSDLGGPSANMYGMAGIDKQICNKCKRASCIFPAVCNNLNTNHDTLIDLYKKVDAIPGIKKSFIGSGIRYDMFFDKDKKIASADKMKYIREIIANHVSGRLKVAPEHTSDAVLKQMRKPSFSLFSAFKAIFEKTNRELGLNQQLIPYFISLHPMCKPEDMAALAAITKEHNYQLEQVQDFTPTPMTLATVIYYSGIDPYTGLNVETAKTSEEKKAQRSFFFWYKNEEHQNIRKILSKINRVDLIEKLLGKKANPDKNSQKPTVKSTDIPSKNQTLNRKKKR